MAKEYVVQRNNVCGGILFYKPQYESENTNLEARRLTRVKPMLFSVGYENALAKDLLCTTPTTYPIKGKSELKGCQFTIGNYVELYELLKYLKCGVFLTQKDLRTFYHKVLMNPKWLEKHRELFGWEIEEGTGEWVHHKDLETLPFSIYTSLEEIIPPTKQMARAERRLKKIEPGYNFIKKRR